MKLRDLPAVMKQRGNDRIEGLQWIPSSTNANIWVGIVYSLLRADEPWISGKEALSFCLELEAAGAGDTVWFRQLKKIAYEMSHE